MANKIHNWIIRGAQNAQWIHKDKKSRVKFRNIYAGIMCGFLILFLGSIVFFALWGLKFDPNKPNPYDTSDGPLYYLIPGIVLFVLVAIAAGFVGGIYFPMVYKTSKQLYMGTEEYKQQLHKYSNEDLTKYKLKDLMWFKKLGWITKTDFDLAMTKKIKEKK